MKNNTMARNTFLALVLTLVILNTTSPAWAQTPKDSVLIIRDKWGIPHIVAGNEQALFYGAGYAAAEDRLLQMVLARYSIQGRLAEVFGSTYLARDKKMRAVGYYRHASGSLPYLTESTRQILQAYADGANSYMTQHPQHLADLFQKYGGQPEKWTAADGVACFLRIAERFDGGWTGEVDALRKFEVLERSVGREQAIAETEMQRMRVDDASAIVTKEEYERYSQNLKQPAGKAALQKRGESGGSEWSPPTMSHNWCVSGSKSTTGLPILESDPQITVESPATWYEFHLQGGKFNVRGIGVPGTPAMLIGYNQNLAWGVTALGSDNADLFQEQLKEGSSSEYKVRDTWEQMEERTEVIKVKNSNAVLYTIRSTRHGSVVNDFVSGALANEIFSLQYTVTAEPATDVEGLLDMMAATDWPSFTKGMEKYRSPGLHMIYADRFDNIGYYTLARLPIRAHNAGIPFRGWTGEEEWKGYIPFGVMPRMLNPAAGFISTANNCPVGSWYPYFIGGGIGDNGRSWRLKELLGIDKKFSPDDFFIIHRDAVNPVARDFVFFSLIAVGEEKPVDRDVLAAAAILTGWDFQMHTSFAGYALVSAIPTVINRSLRGTPLENKYLGATAGLVQLFKDLEAHYDSTGQLLHDASIRAWLISQLGECYRQSGIKNTGARPFTLIHPMKYQNNLEGYGSLAAEHDLSSPPLSCGVVETIWSQLGNSYSQLVNLASVDSSFTLIPPGNSELPDSKHFSDQMSLWAEGKMHGAPLSFDAVQKIAESRQVLTTTSITIIDGRSEFQSMYALNENYPNPFNPSTTIRFQLPKSSMTSLKIFNALGQAIATLVEGQREAGLHQVQWNAMDIASGVYFYRLQAGGFVDTKKMILLH